MTEISASPLPQSTIITDTSFIKGQNRGAITTLFDPPASCTDTLTTQQPDYSGMFFGHSWDPYFDVSCYPLGTLASEDLVQNSRWVSYYHSPAICPRGWSTVTTFDSDIPGPDDDTYIYRGVETTVAVCCPSGYGYASDGHLCASVVTRNQRVPYVSPTYLGNGWERGSVSTSTIAAETTIFGDGLQIWWQSSDEALLAAAASSTDNFLASTTSPAGSSDVDTSSIPSPLPSAVQTSSLPSPTSTPPPQTGGGLSTSAKAGIGAGIGAFGLAAAIAAVSFLLWRKKQARTPDLHMQPEFVGVSASVGKYANRTPQELPARDHLAELY